MRTRQTSRLIESIIFLILLIIIVLFVCPVAALGQDDGRDPGYTNRFGYRAVEASAKRCPANSKFRPAQFKFESGKFIIAPAAFLTSARATPQKSPCDGLIAALGRAQGDYNRARSARIKAEGDLNRARNNVKSIAARIKANETQQSKADAVLDQLKEERARCDDANGDLAPLSGNCATVQARIDKANKDIAALRADHGRLEDQLSAAQMDVERNEREFAAKQAAEAAALAALDKAKKDAAGCRRAA